MPQIFLESQEAYNPMKSLQNMYHRPTLFLGLGGTGCQTVGNLKKLFERTFEGYEAEGVHDVIPAGIQFLGFDSAATDCPEGLIADQEWIQFKGDLTQRTMSEIRKHPFYQDWIPSISAWNFKNGAGGYRTLGKVLFSRNVTLFANHFSSKLMTARSHRLLDDHTPTVYVFAGLAGGTGSGALLEACFYIRQNYPDVRIIGILGVVEGDSGAPQDLQTNASVGCYAALREINTFQDEYLLARLQGQYQAGIPFRFPVGNHTGVYTKPFDFIMLVGGQDHRGTPTLTNPRSLTAFMARTAFMLTAYPANTAKGARSFESEMCDFDQLDEVLHGGLATYLVPGFGQLRLPRSVAAQYMACRLSSRALGALLGGTVYDEANLRAFVASNRLSVDALAEAVGYNSEGRPIVSTDWLSQLSDLFQKAEKRYSNSKAILEHGKSLGAPMLNSKKKEMSSRQELLVAAAIERINDEVARCLKNPAIRLQGTKSFIRGLMGCLNDEFQSYDQKVRQESAMGLEIIKQDWNAIKGLVTDVCTDSGPLDRFMDKMNASHALTQYVDFLNNHQGSVLRWARQSAATEAMSQVIEHVTKIERTLSSLDGVLQAADSLIQDKQLELARTLSEYDAGSVVDAVNINGFNLLGPEWRERYLGAEHRNADNLLNGMCAGSWTPAKWLELVEQDSSEDVRRRIAQDVFDRIWELDTHHVNGISVKQVFSESRLEASEKLAALLSHLVSPQLQHNNMVSDYGQRPVLGFIGNIDDLADDVLKQQSGLQKLSKAIAFEDDTICYLQVVTQVALHGCDVLINKIGPRYENWRKENAKKPKDVREKHWRMHYGFAGTDSDYETWRLPLERTIESDSLTSAIGRAFAISMILTPERFGPHGFNDPEIHNRLNAAFQNMDKQSRNPRQKRLGLFKVGKADFWLMPFFDILNATAITVKDSEQDIADPELLGVDRPFARKNRKSSTGSAAITTDYVFEGIEAPVRLGGNLVAARDLIQRDEKHRDMVRRWVAWFEEQRSSFFTDKSLSQALLEAYHQALELQKRHQVGTEERGLWAAVAQDIQTTWRDSLL